MPEERDAVIRVHDVVKVLALGKDKGGDHTRNAGKDEADQRCQHGGLHVGPELPGSEVFQQKCAHSLRGTHNKGVQHSGIHQ